MDESERHLIHVGEKSSLLSNCLKCNETLRNTSLSELSEQFDL